MNTKISVIIPVYNMNKYISKCLDSIINQTLEKIEIITINDGSTDKSLEVLNEYAHKFNYIKVITQENQGQGMAKNKGIINAKGKYITFMDPDDFYPNNTCLQEMYMAAEKNDVLICGGIRIENYNGERTIFDIDTRKFYCNKIVKIADYVGIYGHTRYIYNTNLIRENNISFPPYKRFEDQPFTIKALVSAGTFFGLDKEVYEHRIGHKKENYTLRISLDILCGIKDVFKIIKENNLIKIYENSMKNIHKEYMVPFYKYSFCGNPQIDEQIEEINEIVKNWIGQYENIILSKNKVELMREKCLKQYNSIMDKLHCNQKKIFMVLV